MRCTPDVNGSGKFKMAVVKPEICMGLSTIIDKIETAFQRLYAGFRFTGTQDTRPNTNTGGCRQTTLIQDVGRNNGSVYMSFHMHDTYRHLHFYTI